MRARWVIGITAGLVALAGGGLAAVVLTDRGPDLPDGALSSALEVLPADVGTVQVGDAVAARERLGLDAGLTREDDPREWGPYVDALNADAPWSLPVGLSGTDSPTVSEIDWWADWAVVDDSGAGNGGMVVALSDSVELDSLAAGLTERGYSGETQDGRTELRLDLSSGRPDLAFATIVLDAERNLMITDDESGAVLDVLDGAESAADAGTFDEVVDGAETPEYAALATTGVACGPPGGPRVTAEQAEAYEAALEGLGTADAVGSFVETPDGVPATRSRLVLADDDDASADADARRAFLADGDDPARGPISDLVTVTEVSTTSDHVDVLYRYAGAGESDGAASLPAEIGADGRSVTTVCSPG